MLPVVALLASLVLGQATCEVVSGCVGANCKQWVMCGSSSVLPATGACAAGQYATGTTTGGVTCDTMASNISAAAQGRSLNANFTPSASKATFVTYSVQVACSASLAGNQSSTVELRSDSAATPTTVRATGANSVSVSIAIALTTATTVTVPLTYVVPAGHNVRLVSSGTCTVTLVSQTEVSLG